MRKKHRCPIFRTTIFSKTCSYEYCEVCGWTDDFYQEENPDEDRFANSMSLNEDKEAYEKGIRVE